MTRPVPMLGDLSLDAVSHIRHTSRGRWAAHAVVGLEGDLQQRLGRGSHEIELSGIVHGEGARDALGELQSASSSGEPVAFTTDITQALELEQVVVVEATFEELAARPGLFRYHFLLREAPPVPPPLEVEPFGGLGGFGDLGFDTDILGDIMDAAGDLQDVLEAAQDALGKLDALAALGDLALGNPLQPMQDAASSVGTAAADAPDAANALNQLLEGP